MRKKVKPEKNLVIRSLELLGLPSYLLFTLLALTFVTFISLFTKSIRSLSQIKVPHLTFRLPKAHFNQPKKRHIKHITEPNFRYRNAAIIFLGIVVVTSMVAGLFYWYILRDLPPITLLADHAPSLTTKIYDRNGTLLYQIYKDQNRTLVHLSDLPHYVWEATLAAEDKNFYSHPGLDVTGIARAAITDLENCNLGAGSCTLEGGSTLTQQLVKNVLLSPQKSLTRKLKELVLSLEAEHTYTKDQILEMYLNQISYGGTSYGIEEAAESYFGKHAKDLSLAEAALLASLPVAPTTLSPFGTTPYLGKVRQEDVLQAMVSAGDISQKDANAAKDETLAFHPEGVGILAPHFVMYIKDLLVKEFGEDMVDRGGLSVVTSLDLKTQSLLQKEINTELSRLKNLHVGNGAGLVINPKSGDILAMVGSHDFFDTKEDGQVNVTLQLRQPGSSIKPVTYSLAFMNGFTPNSTIDDSPICYRQIGSADWCPRDYDGTFHGTVSLRTALASSLNVPATKLLNTLGVDNMVKLGRQMGITSWDNPSQYGLALTLGGGAVRMIDMAQVYSILADGGEKIPLRPILSIKDSSGKELLQGNSSEYQQVIPAAVAYEISSILSDNGARALAFGTNSVLNIPGKIVAVKTGTTNDLRDNWTFGYTPNILVATWVGNNDNSPMSSVASGITGASPIWSHTMSALLQGVDTPPFAPPSTMVRAVARCQGTTPVYDYFIPGTEPKIDCTNNQGGTITDSAASIVYVH